MGSNSCGQLSVAQRPVHIQEYVVVRDNATISYINELKDLPPRILSGSCYIRGRCCSVVSYPELMLFSSGSHSLMAAQQNFRFLTKPGSAG
jgi:hypothetical protein